MEKQMRCYDFVPKKKREFEEVLESHSRKRLKIPQIELRGRGANLWEECLANEGTLG